MKLQGHYLTPKELREEGFKGFGHDVKIHSRASIYGVENIRIGNNARIDDFAVIIATGPLEIGDHVSIHNFCYIASKYGLILEDFVTLAPGVMIFTSSDDYTGRKLTGPTLPKEFIGGKKGRVLLQKHVIVGAQSVILPDCTIGIGTSVGALSLVNRSLGPWGIYAGIPVKKIGDRKRDLLKLAKNLENCDAQHRKI